MGKRVALSGFDGVAMMTARKVKAAVKKSAGKLTATKATTKKAKTKPAERALKGFFHPEELGGTFGFARFYWEPGEGSRASIAPQIRKKRQPAGAEKDADTAARVEVLLPPDAPEDYCDVDCLVRRYEEWLPDHEPTAFAQVTVRFPDAPNLHSRYEDCRAWLREHFAIGLGLPVIAILHAPYLAGSDAPGHVHGLVFPARLSRFGWSGSDRAVATDIGQSGLALSWTASKEAKNDK